jgi:hypothetical protein
MDAVASAADGERMRDAAVGRGVVMVSRAVAGTRLLTPGDC